MRKDKEIIIDTVLNEFNIDFQLNKTDLKKIMYRILLSTLDGMDIDESTKKILKHKFSRKLFYSYDYSIQDTLNEIDINVRLTKTTLASFISVIIDSYINLIKERLLSGGVFDIFGFGKLTSGHRKIGKGIIPYNGLERKERTVPKINFKISRSFKEKLYKRRHSELNERI